MLFTWLARSQRNTPNTSSPKHSSCCPDWALQPQTHKCHLLAVNKSSLQSTVKRVGLHHPPQAGCPHVTAQPPQGCHLPVEMGWTGAAAQGDEEGGFLTARIPCPHADGTAWQCQPGKAEEISTSSPLLAQTRRIFTEHSVVPQVDLTTHGKVLFKPPLQKHLT